MSGEWGPWIEHDGLSSPNIPGPYEYAWTGIPDEDGSVFVHWFKWLYKPVPGQGLVLRYRVKRPRGLLQLVEIAENLPERVDA